MSDSGTRAGAMAGNRKYFTAVGAVIVTGLLLYVRSLGYLFVSDDIELIVENYWFSTDASMYDVAVRSIHFDSYWRPLTMLSFYVNYMTVGLSPWLYHATQLLLHGIVIFLVILWAQLATDSRRVAVLTGLIFALHPMLSETVCFISARCNIFVTMGLMGSLAASELVQHKRIKAGLWTYAIAALIAVFAKESGILILGVPVVYWVYGSVRSKDTGSAKRFLKPYAIMAITGIVFETVYLTARFFVIQNIDSSSVLHKSAGLVVTMAYRLSYWLGQLLLPLFSNPDYQWFGKNPGMYEVVFSLSSMIFIVVGLVYLWHRKHWTWLLCAVLFLMVISPFLGFVSPKGRAFSESWMYMALPFFALPLAALFARGLSSAKYKKIALPLLVIVLTGYGALSIVHAQKWATPESITLGALEADPGNPKALHNYAQELHEQGNDAEAKKVLWSTVAHTPQFAPPYEFLGFLYLWEKDFIRAEKVVRLGLESTATKDRLYGLLATIMLQTNRPQDALAVLNEAPDTLRFKEKPRLIAAALLQLGRTDEALKILNTYLKQFPDDKQTSALYQGLLKKQKPPQ